MHNERRHHLRGLGVFVSREKGVPDRWNYEQKSFEETPRITPTFPTEIPAHLSTAIYGLRDMRWIQPVCGRVKLTDSSDSFRHLTRWYSSRPRENSLWRIAQWTLRVEQSHELMEDQLATAAVRCSIYREHSPAMSPFIAVARAQHGLAVRLMARPVHGIRLWAVAPAWSVESAACQGSKPNAASLGQFWTQLKLGLTRAQCVNHGICCDLLA